MQASGHRFDPDRLHHCVGSDARHISRDEENEIRTFECGKRGIWPLFDIVNGF